MWIIEHLGNSANHDFFKNIIFPTRSNPVNILEYFLLVFFLCILFTYLRSYYAHTFAFSGLMFVNMKLLKYLFSYEHKCLVDIIMAVIFFFCCFIFSFEFYFIFFLYSRFLLVIHFIHISVYMSMPISQFITPPTPPTTAFPPWCPYVCSLHLCLYFCPANQFICTIFLGSTYMR